MTLEAALEIVIVTTYAVLPCSLLAAVAVGLVNGAIKAFQQIF